MIIRYSNDSKNESVIQTTIPNLKIKLFNKQKQTKIIKLEQVIKIPAIINKIFLIFFDIKKKFCKKKKMKIPDEIIWEIFLFLQLKDIYNCLLVCKRFYGITLNDNFWKQVSGICDIYYNNFDFTTTKQKKIEHSNIIVIHSRDNDIIHINDILKNYNFKKKIKKIHIKHYNEKIFENYGGFDIPRFDENPTMCIDYEEIKKNFPKFKNDQIKEFILPITCYERGCYERGYDEIENIEIILNIEFLYSNNGIKILLDKKVKKVSLIGWCDDEACAFIDCVEPKNDFKLLHDNGCYNSDTGGCLREFKSTYNRKKKFLCIEEKKN